VAQGGVILSPRIKPESAPVPSATRGLLRLRPRVWIALFLILALGVSIHFLWQRIQPALAGESHYLLAIENIHITPPPPWIHADIKAEVIRDGGLAGAISLLDPWDALSKRVREAFEFHPWVHSVERIAKRPPRALDVRLKYRRPIAAVESADADGIAFLPIDEHAVRLPDRDLSDAERRHLPRISGIVGRPLVGDRWDDPRVTGAAKLAAALADVWRQLHLVEILPATDRAYSDERSAFAFELITSGGTRIVWGAAPGSEAPAGESPLAQKRARLLEYATQNGSLQSIDGPARLDVRSSLVVTPRTARSKAGQTTDRLKRK
jgi:hypothetical protein